MSCHLSDTKTLGNNGMLVTQHFLKTAFFNRKWRLTQNGDENAKFQLWEIFYGDIRFQHYHMYQKSRVRKRSMQSMNILGGLLFIDLTNVF